MAPLPPHDTFGAGAFPTTCAVAHCGHRAMRGKRKLAAQPPSPRGDAARTWSDNLSNGQGAEGRCPQLLRIIKYTADAEPL
ncbi:MAG: hypothetical protein C4346_16440 [Chloroflexota bacterium]